MRTDRSSVRPASLALLVLALLVLGCPKPVDQEGVERVKELRAQAEELEFPEAPEPPAELSAPHRQSLRTFRELCESLLGTCRDAIGRCATCDIRSPACHRQCEFMTAICDAAGKCVDAYIASLQVAPE